MVPFHDCQLGLYQRNQEPTKNSPASDLWWASLTVAHQLNGFLPQGYHPSLVLLHQTVHLSHLVTPVTPQISNPERNQAIWRPASAECLPHPWWIFGTEIGRLKVPHSPRSQSRLPVETYVLHCQIKGKTDLTSGVINCGCKIRCKNGYSWTSTDWMADVPLHRRAHKVPWFFRYKHQWSGHIITIYPQKRCLSALEEIYPGFTPPSKKI